jgi:hypothetical protein
MLSPILSVKSSPSKVDQAYATIDGLKSKLTGAGSLQEIAQSFSITMINDVEDMLNALKERGYDRALEKLVDGDPASFPEMQSDEASFGRMAMSAMAEVAVEDINEPTTTAGNQFQDVHQRLVQEIYDDKNPLNDFSDMEDEPGDPVALEMWEGLE